ncbi:MAG: ABC transporter permease subunit, partial [Firmicutes bacterium]|nr:ABC transporter permease subunit [Bacillota bacterium]
KKNRVLLLMVLPGAVWHLLFRYLPMFGVVIAFKQFRIDRRGLLASIIHSEWVGFKNFEFLFRTRDAWVITRNTLGYNFLWIFLGLFITVSFAIMLTELNNKRFAKLYQTGMFFPYFLSWIVAGYFVYTLLSVDRGVFNMVIKYFGGEGIDWYQTPKYWPVILTFMNIWKGTGYGCVIYLAALCGIDRTYYEAAMLDGAGKWQQIKHITLPMLTPLMITLTILAIGRIFYADFGLFYSIPRNAGILFPVTNVIDTYVYRGLRSTGNVEMTTAAGLYQSFVGFILIIITNKIVKKIDKEHALF